MAVDLGILLKTMIKNKASDLHIRSDSKSYVRIFGSVKPIDGSFMSAKEVEDLAYACMSPYARAQFEQNHDTDFSLDSGETGRFRFNVFTQRGKIAISIRHIGAVIPSMEELNLPYATLKKLIANERGLILVTGITGSGKSTTLASMIDYINSHYDYHIITLEDPIEYLHSDKLSIVSQREIGIDSNSFVDSLSSAMRQDPDVILVGEIRDLETTQAAITAAETGHLVFSTVHTSDAAQTIDRIIDLYPPHHHNQIRSQLSDVLKGIISQRLLPSIKGGRIPAVDLMINTPHISKMIAENHLESISDAQRKGEYYGMTTFNQSLVRLYKDGLVSLENVLAAATNPDDVLLAIRGISPDLDITSK